MFRKFNRNNKKKSGKRALSVFMAMLALMMLAVPMASADPIEFTGVDIGVTVTDMIDTAVNFLGIYSLWVLLAVAVLFTPVLIWFIFWVIGRVRRASIR